MHLSERLFGKKEDKEMQSTQTQNRSADELSPMPGEKKPVTDPCAVTRDDLGIKAVLSAQSSFQLKRSFSDSQLEALRLGHRGNMDDKWSWFMEDEALFICRTWLTSTLCYRIDLALKDNCHIVSVFQPMRENWKKEKDFINALLNARIGPEKKAEPFQAEQAEENGGIDRKTIRIATRADWKTAEMPEKNSTFILERTFTAEQIDALRRGNIPQAMEDKWFWFMEGDTLYAHRSWTGLCVYRIDFSFTDSRHTVTVNQDPEQRGITGEAKDRQMLNNLLNWWSQPDYNYYGEWISETVNMLKQSGQLPRDALTAERVLR